MSIPRYKWQPTTRDIAADLGIPVSQVVRFDHNTSPFPTDWASPVAAGAARALNEYPGANYRPLREAAARYLGVAPTQVVPGAGVDEILLLAARAFLRPGARSVAAGPTYPLYRIAAAQAGADHVEVPPGDDLAFPLDALAAAAADADVLWLCVPNNPTGDRIDDADVRRLVDTAGGITVLDAAYAEFCGDSWAELVHERDDVLVSHTMSKAFGLAGARVGFGVGAETLIDALDGVRPPGSIAEISALVAERALGEPDRMRANVERLLAERARLAAGLAAVGFGVRPSTTNFLLCEVGPDAGRIADALFAEGLVVRRFPAGRGLDEHLRFTVRSPEEDDRLLDALRRAHP